MTVVGPEGLLTVGWFLLLWVLVLVVSIISKSLLANIALTIVSVLGVDFARHLAGTTETVRNTLAAVFILCIALAVFQMLFKVERI